MTDSPSERSHQPGDWVTTTTLLAGLRDYDNTAAWDRFVKRFRQPVAHFVREMGIDAAASEDVAQETLLAFAEAYRQGTYDRTQGRLSSWLFGIAFRQAQAQRRRSAHAAGAARGESPGKALLDEPTAGEAWERIWERHILERSLRQARTQFSDSTFEAFERVSLQEQSPQEAAEALGVTVKAVYNAKHRVLQKIRELMIDLEAVPEA